MSNETASAPNQYPLLPLRDVVVFPHMVIPLFVGRPKSIKAMEIAMEAGKSILLVAQKSAAKDEPVAEDLYKIGCISNILQMLKLPDGTVKVLVEGSRRARIQRIDDARSHYVAEALAVPADAGEVTEIEAMGRAARRYHRRAPAAQARAEAAGPGDVRGQAAPRAPAVATGNRDRHSPGREAHPRPRQAADGKEPARVLPQRAGQGDPERARPGRGRGRSRGN